MFLDYLDVEGGPLSPFCSVAVWLLLPSSFLSALPLVASLLCTCLVVICWPCSSCLRPASFLARCQCDSRWNSFGERPVSFPTFSCSVPCWFKHSMANLLWRPSHVPIIIELWLVIGLQCNTVLSLLAVSPYFSATLSCFVPVLQCYIQCDRHWCLKSMKFPALSTLILCHYGLTLRN